MKEEWTYIFNVRARVDSDHITVLDTEVMPDHTVDTDTAVIEIVVRQHNQNGILAHFTLDQNRVTAEKLQSIHCVVGEGNNGVIIVDGIGHTVGAGRVSYSLSLSLSLSRIIFRNQLTVRARLTSTS